MPDPFYSDDYSQSAPDYDAPAYGHPVNIPAKDGSTEKTKAKRWGKEARGNKGDRQRQSARYYKRHKGQRRAYMRLYMANRRSLLPKLSNPGHSEG